MIGKIKKEIPSIKQTKNFKDLINEIRGDKDNPNKEVTLFHKYNPNKENNKHGVWMYNDKFIAKFIEEWKKNPIGK